MKILLLNSFLYARGGDTTCLFTQAEALKKRGHTLIPFACLHPDNLPALTDPYFPPCPDPKNPSFLGLLSAPWSFRAAHALNRLLDQTEVDIAHAHHLHRHLTPSVLAVLKRRKIPVVWTLHDYELLCPTGLMYRDGAFCNACHGRDFYHAVQYGCGGAKKSQGLALEKLLHRWLHVWKLPDKVIAPSQFLAEKLLEAGFPSEKIEIIPNPVPPIEPSPGGQGWLMAGRLTPEKGVEDAVQAAKLVREPLVVYGEGPEKTRLESISPNVYWAGKVAHTRMLKAIERSSVVVVPSRWPENQPYAVLEAMAAGKAVVATAVGGIPELINDGVNGRLVPPGKPEALAEAVQDLLNHPEVAQTLGTQARTLVRFKHDPAQHAATLEKLYGSL